MCCRRRDCRLRDATAGAETAMNINALSPMPVNRITAVAAKASPLTFTAARAKAQRNGLVPPDI